MLKGNENAVDYECWLEDIDQLFDSLDYSDDRRIRFVVHQLRDVAKSWWISMKKELENRDKGAEFATLRQGNLNIEEYVAKFDSMLKFAPHFADNKEAKADQFINGLNPKIFKLVNTGRLDNFFDAMNQAKEQKQKGVERFLIYAIDVLKSSPELIDIPVVREFVDVFPNEISRLPHIREGSCVYSNIYLRSGYHQLRVREENVPKTAFRMREMHKQKGLKYGWPNSYPKFINEAKSAHKIGELLPDAFTPDTGCFGSVAAAYERHNPEMGFRNVFHFASPKPREISGILTDDSFDFAV
ncbi:uncharacterized protein [Henckelia pumila]|uniref:uncharacterized protein n=1 Tax=Henckelia pumila TaxID=405737 RepID=UPI003C6E8C68